MVSPAMTLGLQAPFFRFPLVLCCCELSSVMDLSHKSVLSPRFPGSRCCRSCSYSPAWQSWLCCPPSLTECGGLYAVDAHQIPKLSMGKGILGHFQTKEHLHQLFRGLRRSADGIFMWTLSNVPNVNVRRFVWTADNHITF